MTAPIKPASTPGDLVARHAADLVGQALATHREQPDLRIVGLVIDPGAPEAEAFSRLIPVEHQVASRGFIGTMPRDVAIRMLGESAPGALDWFEDDGVGAQRVLPVIHAAKRGARTTAIRHAMKG